MSAYVVADLEIQDAEGFEAYKGLVPATIEKYGGHYLIRGGKVKTLEGTWSPGRVVVLEFPSAEMAQAWYDSAEYAAPKSVRQASARSNLILVEGVRDRAE